jgi:hypothetical protein
MSAANRSVGLLLTAIAAVGLLFCGRVDRPREDSARTPTPIPTRRSAFVQQLQSGQCAVRA